MPKAGMAPPKTRERRAEFQPSMASFWEASAFFAMVMVLPERLDGQAG
ncbi:MAG: hypothetical protein II543_06375 [Desulfovibrio sp.]|nr:hypothetical protein [Desulfovibrio sp.]